MRHVFLPADHTEKDLVLAGQLVTALDSGELYIALTASGDRSAPVVEAAVRDARPTSRSEHLTLLGALVHSVGLLLSGLFGPRQAIPSERKPERPALEPARG